MPYLLPGGARKYNLIFSTLAILTLFFVFTGIGLLFPWRVHQKEQNFFTLLGLFWTGWVLVLGFLQLWHLVFPVGPAAFAVTAACSLAGWGWNGKSILEQARAWGWLKILALGALAVIPAAMLANQAMFAMAYTDHGLYHMQSVQWIARFAIVPGLGNLHHRLAFNNANFLYAALINWGPLQDRAYYVSNTLLGWVLILTCAAGFYQVFNASARRSEPLKRWSLYFALMLPVAFNHLSTTHLPGYSPDVPNFILMTLLAGELLRLIEARADAALFQRQIIYMTLLAAAGVIIKLAFGFFGILMLLAALAVWLARFRPSRTVGTGRILWRSILAWGLAGAALVIPWLIRNVILSGYLLYPSTVISFPVPWKIPEALVDPIASIIADWARTVSNTIVYSADLPWFLNLWSRFPFFLRQMFIITLAISGLDVLLILALDGRNRPLEDERGRKTALDWPSGLVWCIAALSLVYWFLAAPDYRFSGAIFWILLVSALLLGYQALVETRLAQKPLLLAASLLVGFTLWLSPNHFTNNLSRAWMFYPPAETEQAEKVQSLATMQTRVTASGLEVHMPPPPSDQCWNLPLPCMPPSDFSLKLKLIDPSDMQKGFYLPDW